MSGETTPYDQVRAGNADREAVVSRLNKAFSEGRLELTELDERVSAAYAAKTLGELRPLTADLPAEPTGHGGPTGSTPTGSTPPHPPTPLRRPTSTADLKQAALELAHQRINAKVARDHERTLRRQQRRDLTRQLTDTHPVLAWATASTICFVIWLVSGITGGGLQAPWFLWVAGPWGALLLMRYLGQRSS